MNCEQEWTVSATVQFLLPPYKTRGGEINMEGDVRRSPLIPDGLEIPWYVMFHGKVVQPRHIIAGENETE